MTSLKSTKRPPKAKQHVSDTNPLEQLRGIMGGVAQTGLNLIKDTVSLNQLGVYTGYKETGGKREKVTGDLFEGEELDLKELKQLSNLKKQAEEQEQARALDIQPGIDYRDEILHAEKRAAHQEDQELKNDLQEIAIEIKKLSESSKELQTQFKDVALEQHTAKPGKYHKSFFEWLLAVVKTARMKVEDSGAWLAAMHSKKKSREYGAMAKKHGTTFSLSNERVVSTQVG